MLREALNFLLRVSPFFSIKRKRPISEPICKDNIQNNVRIGLPYMQHRGYENITSANYENNHIYGTKIAPEVARERIQNHSILEDRPSIVLRTADAYAYTLNTDKYSMLTGLNTVIYGNFI